jgi:hypothetical protein
VDFPLEVWRRCASLAIGSPAEAVIVFIPEKDRWSNSSRKTDKTVPSRGSRAFVIAVQDCSCGDVTGQQRGNQARREQANRHGAQFAVSALGAE